MAQYRQSGFDRVLGRNGGSDHVSIGIRASNPPHKQSRTVHHRRFKGRKISIGALVLILSVAFVVSVSVFLYLSGDKEVNVYTAQDDETGNDTDFLTNVTRTERLKVLKFGHGSVAHGRDSRYWDRDDRRRDEDYSEEALEHATGGARDGSTGNVHAVEKGNIIDKKSSFAESHKGSNHKGIGLYNEAGRDELKMYEAEYEASLKGAGRSRNEDRDKNHLSNDTAVGIHDEEVDAYDEYDDGIDSHDSRAEDYDVAGHGQGDHKNVALSHVVDSRGSSDELHAGTKGQNIDEDMSGISTEDSSLTSLHSDEISVNSRHVSVVGGQSSRRSTSEKRSASKKKPKRHKFLVGSIKFNLPIFFHVLFSCF